MVRLHTRLFTFMCLALAVPYVLTVRYSKSSPYNTSHLVLAVAYWLSRWRWKCAHLVSNELFMTSIIHDALFKTIKRPLNLSETCEVERRVADRGEKLRDVLRLTVRTCSEVGTWIRRYLGFGDERKVKVKEQESMKSLYLFFMCSCHRFSQQYKWEREIEINLSLLHCKHCICSVLHFRVLDFIRHYIQHSTRRSTDQTTNL